MNKRIELLIKTEGLTNSKFASILGIQRSNITHIIDGRNKPSIAFLQKFMTNFPYVNIEWLISGTGAMYNRDKLTGQKTESSPTLFPETDIKQPSNNREENQTVLQNVEQKVSEIDDIPRSSAQMSEQTKDFNNQIIQESAHTVQEVKPEPEIKPESNLAPKKISEKETVQTEENVSQLHNPEHSNNLSKQPITNDSNTIEKERHIECVLMLHSDGTFKYYRPE
jgi:transcriptional regulator with XRE-family HTH domain